MTDLAALLGGARERVRTARATLRSAQDPAATLRAWTVAGPWQAEAAAGEYAAFGMPPEPTVEVSRQELVVDASRGMLLATAALNAGAAVFHLRRSSQRRMSRQAATNAPAASSRSGMPKSR